jgi:hypothetical protein
LTLKLIFLQFLAIFADTNKSSIMKNFIALANTLNRDELQKLEDLVDSPFHNKRSDIVKFFKHIKAKLPVTTLDKEEIYRTVYGRGKYNEQVIVNLVSRMQHLIKRLLIYNSIEEDNTVKTNALAFELAKRGLNRLTERTIENGFAELKNEFYTVEYLKKYYDHVELRESLVVNLNDFKAKVESSYLRGEAAVNYYILNLLRIANDLVAFKHVNSVLENDTIFNGFFGYFDFEGYLLNLEKISSPYYAITAVFYYGLLSKMNDPDGEYREKLKKITFENLENMKYQDQASCWTMLFAAYVFTNTPQKQDIAPDVHEINRYFVERDILVKDELGYIMENNYHNIAFQAINAKDYDWAQTFLETYKTKLPPGASDNAYNSVMARCLFEKGDYNKCLGFLSKMKVDSIMTRLNTSTLFLKCYYELGYFEQAISANEALRSFYSKNKVLTPQLKRSLVDFIKFAKVLLRVKTSGKRLSEEKYLQAKNSAGFNSKPWVIEKMEQLL